jgi:hypothetical protein
LAEALRLTDAERHYLFTLAGKLDSEPEAGRYDDPEAILDSVKHITEPAYILDQQWTALAWNKAAEKLFSAWLKRDSAIAQRNLLRFTFLHPAARTLIDNWPNRARRLVFEFRADCGLHADDDKLKILIAELSSSSKEFNSFWQDYGVMEREGGLRVFHHNVRSTVSYTQATFYPATRRDLKLVLLLPA